MDGIEETCRDQLVKDNLGMPKTRRRAGGSMTCSVFRLWQGAGHRDPPGWLLLPCERHETILSGPNLVPGTMFFSC